MGDEIRGSSDTVNNLNDTFQNTTIKLKSTFNNMMVMASKSGVSIKMWLLIFFIVAILFFWVWISQQLTLQSIAIIGKFNQNIIKSKSFIQ